MVISRTFHNPLGFFLLPFFQLLPFYITPRTITCYLCLLCRQEGANADAMLGAEGGGGEEAEEGGGANHELRRGVGVLMDAMRDLLNNIRMAPPPVENGQDGEGEGGEREGAEGEERGEWD